MATRTGEEGSWKSIVNRQAETMKSPSKIASIEYSAQCKRLTPIRRASCCVSVSRTWMNSEVLIGDNLRMGVRSGRKVTKLCISGKVENQQRPEESQLS